MVSAMGPHGIIAQEIEPFISTAVRASNTTRTSSTFHSETDFVIPCKGEDIFGLFMLSVGETSCLK
jgi:hypothetical protein